MNEENYILEETNNDSHEYLNENGVFMPESAHSSQLASSSNTPHSLRSALNPPSSLGASPSIPTLQLSPTLYSNGVVPCVGTLYPCTIVNQKQAAQDAQRNIVLPESFRFLQDKIDDPRVRNLYSRIAPCFADNVADTIKMNFFFGYAVFWFLSSSVLRQLVLNCAKTVEEKRTSQSQSASSPSPSKSSSPEQSALPSMSPSIQPVYMILQVAPQSGESKSEVDVLSGLVTEVSEIVESPSMAKGSKVFVMISQAFLKNNLLSKYQQFGISLSDFRIVS